MRGALLTAARLALPITIAWLASLSSCALEEFTTGDVCGVFSYSDASCEACVTASCCGEARACRDSADCAALFECLDACPVTDFACVASCAETFPSNEASVSLTRCQATQCSPSCRPSAGFVPGTTAACDDCERTKCSEAAAACHDEPSCSASLACAVKCDDPDCHDACFETTPDLTQTYRVLLECHNNCLTACDIGRSFSCIGAFDWDTGAVPEVQVYMPFVSVLDQIPYVGLSVKACIGGDVNCTSPITQGTTDEQGVVTLAVPSGFQGYFEISGSDLFPLFVYLRRPINFDWSFNFTVPSNSEATLLATVGGVELDPALGILVGNPLDCRGYIARGVSFAVGPSSIVPGKSEDLYFENGVPSSDLDATTGDRLGGGWVNLAPGAVTVTSTYEEGGEVKEFSTTTAQMRAGALTLLQLYPASDSSN